MQFMYPGGLGGPPMRGGGVPLPGRVNPGAPPMRYPNPIMQAKPPVVAGGGPQMGGILGGPKAPLARPNLMLRRRPMAGVQARPGMMPLSSLINARY